MDVGKLDKRITFEKKEAGTNSAGEPVNDWVKVKTVWANVRFERGLEAIRNGKDTAVRRASMRIRKRDDIDEGMRVLYAKQYYNIHSILPVDGGGSFMDVVVEGEVKR